eukprot:5842418-Pyramimonas_sp.AAC.1
MLASIHAMRAITHLTHTTDQSDAGSAGIFSRRTNQTQEMRLLIVLHFTGPPVPITATVLSTPQGSFPFSQPVSSSPLSPGSA